MKKFFFTFLVLSAFLLTSFSPVVCQAENFTVDVTRMQYWDNSGLSIDYDFKDGVIELINYPNSPQSSLIRIPGSSVTGGVGSFELHHTPTAVGATSKLEGNVFTVGVPDNVPDFSAAVNDNRWGISGDWSNRSWPNTNHSGTWIVSLKNAQNVTFSPYHAYGFRLAWGISSNTYQDGTPVFCTGIKMAWFKDADGNNKLTFWGYIFKNVTGEVKFSEKIKLDALDPSNTAVDLKVEILSPERSVASYRLNGGDWNLIADITWPGANMRVQSLYPGFYSEMYSPFRTITVTNSGNGLGTVTSNPAGINCGTDCTEPWVQNFTTIILTATPNPGSMFTGWSGGSCSGVAPCTVFLSSNMRVQANFSMANNAPPNIVPSGGGKYEINTPVKIGGQISDIDGDQLSYKWLEGENVLFSGVVLSIRGGEPVNLPNSTVYNLALGKHTLTLRVSDGINQIVSADIDVEIIDDIAPTLAPVANKTILWPASHKMVDITISPNVSDNSGGQISLSAVVSCNELPNGQGDGNTQQDWTVPVIKDGLITLQLRAERSGKDSGRIYTVTITATDISKNTSVAKVDIVVPHDMRGK
ncbi:MAG: hypothetical protein WCQ90_03745 [Deltaproteobacteria bacterium]